MKLLTIISLALAATVLFTSCGKGESSGTQQPVGSCEQVAGDWHLTATGNGNATDFDIYLRLTADGKFEMYQQLQTMRYTKYAGTFAVAGGTMTGVYADGKQWRSSYTATLNAERNVLTLTSRSAADNVSVFERTAIPDDVFNRTESDGSRAVAGDGEATRFL